jgi:two-component system invasion response regulator UvrY
MTTVMIIEDHAVVAEGIATILTRAGMAVLETHTSWEHAATRYASLRPDVVLLDLNVPPDGNGLKLIPLLHGINPKAVVVCVSAASSASEVNAALEAGATGFISKGADPDEFPPLVKLALSGETAVDKRTASKLISAARKQHASTNATSLTERELQVLKLISQGRSNQEIAEDLLISRTSVSDALTRSYRKLNARDRASATRIAIELGIVQSQ